MGEAGNPPRSAVSAMGCVDTEGAREGFEEEGDPRGLDSRRVWLYSWPAPARTPELLACLPTGP